MNNNTFPGFEHKADELSAYLVTLGIFVMSRKEKDTGLVRFTPEDEGAFRKWLDSNNVRDITNEAGSLVLDSYAKQK